MNPMDFFNQKKAGFPFNQVHGTQFSPEYLHQIKNMVKQYNSVMTDDFWGTFNGFNENQKKEATKQILPIEIWESSESIYLSIVVPGLSRLSHAKIVFQNGQVLLLKIKSSSIKPAGGESLIKSELPQQIYEREIFLEKPVNTSDYSSSYDNGILTYTFEKAKDSWNQRSKSKNELEIPFDL
ncbi:Hsp20 family protein [Alkalihalobacillus deserti]|uniref:Hsp20 family protein n=1 Tax=Alkalihalobacillus deserti TaxID=2879466 RepID=UPI001D1332FD|nr:Hsp20 family protein [Alkalihalobacillus deserti]